jgi:pyridinium-3,5-biscarboxylic acid mononucleotide synthase
VDEATLRRLLEDVRSGAMHPDEAVAALARLPYADLGFARVDHHRSLRQGLPEAVYGPGKAPEHCAAIVAELLDGGDGPVVLTRVTEAQATAALAANPGGARTGSTLVWRAAPARPEQVVICTAGTADLPVADECAAVLAAHGLGAQRVTDAGVAGVHRLLADVDLLSGADVVVVVAGMEGALASLVGGLTPAPVVAVPTSVGYGAALEGVTALLAMLSSCASGLTVVGIDNGFGAACAVLRILGPAEVELDGGDASGRQRDERAAGDGSDASGSVRSERDGSDGARAGTAVVESAAPLDREGGR